MVGGSVCLSSAGPGDSRRVAAVRETTAKHGSGAGRTVKHLVYAVVPELLVAVDASGVDTQ
jgi:hypothetical protein